MSTKVTTYFKVQGTAEWEARGLGGPGLVGYFGSSTDSHDTPQAYPPMSLARL